MGSWICHLAQDTGVTGEQLPWKWLGGQGMVFRKGAHAETLELCGPVVLSFSQASGWLGVRQWHEWGGGDDFHFLFYLSGSCSE